MTRGSIFELAGAMRIRYDRAKKGEKSCMLNEFCAYTGYNRKSAIRLLRTPPKGGKRKGRQRTYGIDVVTALKTAWDAADHVCSKRLSPFLPDLVHVLVEKNELSVSEHVRQQLIQLKPSTIDRLLRPYRRQWPRRPHTSGHVRVSSILKEQIPIRTFSEWKNVAPGSLQADLVAHCGNNGAGFFLHTLNTVDVCTSWTECRVVWGKNQARVGTATHLVRQSLPFDLRELHTDNGSEFLNDLLFRWCKREGIRFTRGRPYKKNDQAYIEQKNWSVPRRLVGYHRYGSKAAYEQIAQLYRLVCPYMNFFQPVRKVLETERYGAKVRKRFDEARTPYKRLLASGSLNEDRRKKLQELYQTLNPVTLRRQIDDKLRKIWELADDRENGKDAGEGACG